jgi:hypothetical protein
VDVREVGRVGLREAAQIEPYDDPVGAVLEVGGTSNLGVALRAQIELRATAVVGRAVFVLALGIATATTYHQEDDYKRDYVEQAGVFHAVEDSNEAKAAHPQNFLENTVRAKCAVCAFHTLWRMSSKRWLSGIRWYPSR